MCVFSHCKSVDEGIGAHGLKPRKIHNAAQTNRLVYHESTLLAPAKRREGKAGGRARGAEERCGLREYAHLLLFLLKLGRESGVCVVVLCCFVGVWVVRPQLCEPAHFRQ